LFAILTQPLKKPIFSHFFSDNYISDGGKKVAAAESSMAATMVYSNSLWADNFICLQGTEVWAPM
jgi:hypothetical protein